MLVTRDAALASARADDAPARHEPRCLRPLHRRRVPSWYYEVVAPGFKYNLTDIAAALGLQQLKKAHAFQQRRDAIAARYDAALAGLPLIAAAAAAAGDLHAWHLYVLRLADDAGIARDRFIERLFDARHRLQRALHPAAPAAVLARPLRAAAPGCSRTASAPTSALVSLPIYTRMSDADVAARDRRGARGRCAPEQPWPSGCSTCSARRCALLLLCAAAAGCWRCWSSSIRRGRCSSASSASAATACRSRSTSSARMVPTRRSAGCRSPSATTRASRAPARWLRRTRLDELPQLIDVLRGHMSLVGPRPEVPRYVALYPPALRERVLAVRPGITDPASLAFIDEARSLAARRRPRARVRRGASCRASCSARPTTPSRRRCAPTWACCGARCAAVGSGG